MSLKEDLQPAVSDSEAEETKSQEAALQELQKLVDQHSQELKALTQKFQDQNLRFELKYYEVANWQQEVQQQLAELSKISPAPASAPVVSQPDPAAALKKLEEEYKQLQNWAQDLDRRLKQIQASPLYRVLGRFMGR